MLSQNNTNFPIEITEKYKKYKIEKEPKLFETKGKIKLFSYQKFIEDYLQDYRGLLLYFGLGSGKSIAAINIAESSNRPVIILLPRSLRDNFIEEIITFVPEFKRSNHWHSLSDEDRRKEQLKLESRILKKYTFISSNAGNSADVLLETHKNLDNKLLIIDEVHTLITNMINPNSKNGSKILSLIMNAKNLKLVFLTGTPIVSDPFELAVMFNLLKGYLNSEKDTLFPDNYDEFYQYFVDTSTGLIKNRKIFQERIVGLCSYYQGIRKDNDRKIFPEQLKTRIINVVMSEFQWKRYIQKRREEQDEERKNKFSKVQFVKLVFKKPGRQSNTSFSVGTRQLLNFALPLDVVKPKQRLIETALNVELNKILWNLPIETLTSELGKYGPKIKALLRNIKDNPGKALVYSEFISLEGIGVISRVLLLHGFTNFADSENKKEIKKEKYKTFAIFSGDTSDKLKRDILNTFNSQNNLNGENLRIILMTASGAQGLNTTAVRTVHIMEPYWHNNRIQQIIGRAVRTNSHADLPFKDRTVQPFIYIGVPPEGTNIEVQLGEKYTTDQRIFIQSLKKLKLIDSFLDATREMAIDCQLNFAHNKDTVKECRICIPNNKIMYQNKIKNHLLPGGSNCFSNKKNIQLTDIEIDGQKYKKDSEGRVYQLGPDGIYLQINLPGYS